MVFDEHNIRQAIMAYADGELDAEQRAAMLGYVTANPEWLTVLRDLERLRATARRVMRDSTPAVPDTVRQRITALAPAAALPIGKTSDAPQPFRWRPLAAAAAVALLLGLAGGLMIPSRPPRSPAAAAPTVPLTLAAAVTRVHVDCSRFPLAGHAGPFPTTGPAAALADSVRQAFHADATHPDLSSLGFEFVGAGPCRVPLDGTIHLLYRAADPNRRETLSVFVQADRGQIDLPLRQMAVMTAATEPHPAYVWRADGAVFFLVADAADVADKARDVVQLALAR